jgi:hypothetical protein
VVTCGSGSGSLSFDNRTSQRIGFVPPWDRPNGSRVHLIVDQLPHELCRRRKALKQSFCWRALAGLAALFIHSTATHAQELEPRSYANTPVGLNFLLAGYGYTQGKLAFDPSTQ